MLPDPPVPTVEAGRKFCQSLVASRPAWKLREWTVDAILSTPASFVRPETNTLHYLFAPTLAALKHITQVLKPFGFGGIETSGRVEEHAIYMFLTPGPHVLATYHLLDGYGARLDMNGPTDCSKCDNKIDRTNADNFQDQVQCLNCNQMICMKCCHKNILEYVAFVQTTKKIPLLVCSSCRSDLPIWWYDTVSKIMVSK